MKTILLGPTRESGGRTMMLFCQVLLLVLFIFFFGSLPQASSAQVKLSVGYSPFASSQAAFWVAKDLGIFEKNGLDVELIFIRSASIGVPALLSGTTPIATMGGAAAVRSNLAGRDLVVVGSLKKNTTHTFLGSSK